jgi:hypothetical protein
MDQRFLKVSKSLSLHLSKTPIEIDEEIQWRFWGTLNRPLALPMEDRHPAPAT